MYMRNAKRVITLLVTMVLLVLGVADAVPDHVYAQNLETMQRAGGNLQTLSQDMNIEGSNSIGNMIASELTAKQEEQRENNGCNLFSAEVDKKCVTVSLETVKDGTLVAAIYEEDGIKMLASGTTMVKAGDTEAEVTIDTDSMPSYFYLRIFLVDSDTLQPLASSYESPNYTKEMQEFLSKTTEDFDKDRVYNLDEDKTTNFAVYNEDTQVVPQSSKVNRLVSTDEEKKQYTFENVDENITSLSAGDIFVYDMGDNNLLVVKVADIQKKGTTAIISGEDTSLEEAFDYVKIEGDADTSKVTVDDSTCEEGVVYNGMVEETEDETIESRKKQSVSSTGREVTGEANQVDAVDVGASTSKTLSFSFFNKKLIGGDTNNVKLSGGAELKSTISLKVYISLSYQYLEFKLEDSLKVNLSLSGKGKGEIPFATLGFSPVPGVIIELTPSFVVEVSAKIEVSGTLKGTIGFSVSSEEGIKNLTSTPSFKSSIKTEGTIFIGLSIEPRIAIIHDNIAKVGLKAKAGAEIKATMMLQEPASSSKIHTCQKCIDGDISGKFTLAFETKLLNSEKLKYKYDIANVSVKIADFYYSIDYEEGGFTTCPYLKYKVDIAVKDETGNSLEGVLIKAPFSVVDENEEIETRDVILTDKNGKAVGYLSNGEYILMISRDGYQTVNKKITVKDESKELVINLKKESGNGNNNDENNVLDVMQDCKALSLGWWHSGAITKDGSLYMWGYNSDGQLGDGTTEDSRTPQKILENVVSVSLGESYSGAITKDGSLYMWGDNHWGRLGDGTYDDSHKPKKILENVVSVSLGTNHSGAITKDGSLYMWGNNSSGQLGDGTTEDSRTPQKILENVVSVSLGGSSYSGAITKDGSLYMWGYNKWGQLGDGTDEDSHTPKKILDNVVSVSLGGYHSGAITKDGSLYMWGSNYYGQLGDGTDEYSNKPIKIMGSTLLKTNQQPVGIYARNKIVPLKFNLPQPTTPLYTKSNITTKTANNNPTTTFSNLQPNKRYTFYAMKSKEGENVLSAENLLYINQAVSDKEGNIEFTYQLKEVYDTPELFVVGEEVTENGETGGNGQDDVTSTENPKPTLKPTIPPIMVSNPAKKGTILKVTSKKCKVKVLSASAKNPTVAYQGTTDKKAKSITIPATVTVDGVTYKVTAIANSAFAGNKKITKVTIGKYVKTIGKKAFQGCSALKNMVVKTNNLKTVGKDALKGTNKKLVIKVPSKKLKNYKKYFKGKGNKKVKVKK